MAIHSIENIVKWVGADAHLTFPDEEIHALLYDSRQLHLYEKVLFFALQGKNHNGHNYVEELAQKGVRNFCVSQLPETMPAGCNFLLVADTLKALQDLAMAIRKQSKAVIIGITGSNGKTTVKSWLAAILQQQYRVSSTPKSYNSQIGVPLAVWNLQEDDQYGIFEAGLSQPGEMDQLQNILQPDIGIFTNIGSAHDQYFASREEKINEKLKLFSHTDKIVCELNNSELSDTLVNYASKRNQQLWSWSTTNKGADLYIESLEQRDGHSFVTAKFQDTKHELTIPFADQAALQNLMHCWRLVLELSISESLFQNAVHKLSPVAMRLEMKAGIQQSHIINDTYNSDLESLSVALSFQKSQAGEDRRMLIISDMLQTGLANEKLNQEMGKIINAFDLELVVGIGSKLNAQQLSLNAPLELYPSTAAFLKHIYQYQFGKTSVLIKGARQFQLEQISQRLEEKTHETVLNIYLNRMVANLNYFRAKINPHTRVMAMVKAFSYGSGSVEIAKLLEFHKVDYLGVAYTDEGVTLRKAGVNTPILVLNPEIETYRELIEYNLEPEIFNLNRLDLFKKAVQASGIKKRYPIHLKLETGMNRLGFIEDGLPELIQALKKSPELQVESVFSHMATSDQFSMDEHNRRQIELFERMRSKLNLALNDHFFAHLANSGGIANYPEAQYDLVRLGIGLYGVGFTSEDRRFLQPVSELLASVAQIKKVHAGEGIGYGRSFVADKPMDVAIVSIGYADGFRRSLSNGVGSLAIKGVLYPVVGTVCMDMLMLDVTDSDVTEGDKVEIFGDHISIYDLADKMNTIPYEVLTGIGQRVKRVYYME